MRASRRPGLMAAGRLAMVAWGARLLAPTAAESTIPPEPISGCSIRWIPDRSDTNRITVEVTGPDAAFGATANPTERTLEQWQRMLSVYAETTEPGKTPTVPPMWGTYRLESGRLRFEPPFPFDTGVTYRAVFHPSTSPARPDQSVTATFQRPRPRPTPHTAVTKIYPTGDLLPENLLKFYLHFSAPMSGGQIYQYLHLREAGGREVELPFLELAEELWNPGMTRLTLLIDPGRIKRNVRPLEEIGPALAAGKSYTLIVDPQWPDAAGTPLKAGYQKSFRAGPADRISPDPRQWVLRPPARGTTHPLSISFPDPLDHALAQRMIRVATAQGELVPGLPNLEDQESRWDFIPDQPWGSGSFVVLVQATIEDLAGNNIGKTFEVDLFDGVQRKLTNPSVRLPFEIR